MIIFFNKTTGEILGSIDGRVHFDHHLNVSIAASGHNSQEVERLIIGWVEDSKGNRLPQNMHLWQNQLVWEDPKHPRKPTKERVVFNKQGDIVGFVNK